MATTGNKNINSPLNMLRNPIYNAIMQVLSAAPSAPVQGLYYFDSALDTPRIWSTSRAAWVPLDATKQSNAIPYSALVNLGAGLLLGNGTAAAASPTGVTVGTGLALSASNVLTATGAGGTVTSVTVTTANGVSATVASQGTTPALTFTLGAITPSSVAATGLVSGSNLSGTNTGDQTNITGNAGTATNIAGGVANNIPYQSSANVTVFVAPVANAVLSTNASGVPIESTTLPPGLLIPGMTGSVNAAISAAGATQATATPIITDMSVVTTVGVGNGIALPTATGGRTLYVENKGTNALTIYPASGAQIDGATANTPIVLAVNGRVDFFASSSTQWYSSANDAINTSALVGTVANAQLANSALTLGTTAVSLGATATTIAGLVSVTSTTFVGALNGNASTSTKWTTPITVNGTNLDGSANITITAANPFALSFGNGFAATTAYTGSAAVSLVLGIPTSVGAGSANAVTANSHSHAVALNNNDVTAGLGYTPINKAGDTFTGPVTLAADPTAALGAATKQYVDGAVQSASAGISAKASVVAVSTSNIATMSGLTTAVDGITLGTVGMRVLLVGQTTASQNGPWVIQSSAWTRPTTDANNELETGALWFVEQGATKGITQWWLNSPAAGTPITPGTTAIGIVQFGAAAVYTAGVNGGLQLAGNAFSALIPAGGGVLADSTGLHIDTTVVARKYVNASVGNGSLTTIVLTHNLNTLAITFSLINNATGDIEDVCCNATSVNTATLTFSVAPTSAAYTAVVVG